MTKFFLDQRGCAKNQVDGEIIISNLIAAGFEQAESADEADLIIINSCGFIESGRRKQALKFDDGTFHDEILMYKLL